uniref:Uncharacterized protein n=1 Tax=Helianthus annuus TaxID=4232 RepID=A0A251S5U2_HELAN
MNHMSAVSNLVFGFVALGFANSPRSVKQLRGPGTHPKQSLLNNRKCNSSEDICCGEGC